MKNLLKLSLGLLVCVALFSCSKDEDEKPSVNSVQLGEESFNVNGAVLQGIFVGEESIANISLINASAEQTKTLTISIEPSSEETIPGTYSYPLADGDMVMDNFLTNYTVFEGEGESEMAIESTSLESGTVTVTHNGGDNYSVVMDLTMEDETVFSGEYTGKFFVQIQSVEMPF
ncbi:hypothetical protein [Carboxylicivirga marina]|uniref:Lipocalin-like domain-containing protein n=1 Tax=Carboxylicivirga marina TaxID=2800988 RepID=A0ABS1HF66_9BACT|nr:hypothetical protein [Carboxylicivirga marina]MBK3515938.1 hypothetical protein [Carboxylicivirga marina]